jgi:predicted ATPase
MPLQLSRLTFIAAPGLPGDASPVTILVGPNNSGKSLALREIASWAEGNDVERKVVDQMDVEWPPDEDHVMAMLKPFEAEPEPNQTRPADAFLIAPFKPGGGQNRMWVHTQQLSNQFAQGDLSSAWLRQSVLSHFAVRLDGRTRFNLMQPQPFQDMQVPPQHHLAALFMDDTLRQRVRDLVAKAFPGRYFVIDPTGMQQLRVAMNSRAPEDSAEERNWDERARVFHGDSEGIETLSDGVVSFTGLVAAAISLAHRILLVDEPEAFLHPPLARLLGSSLSSLTQERGASLVVATHSAEFLMGCIESGASTTIVRLTYERNVAGARVLSPTGLKALATEPLLRSTNALSGLFHRGVVVGEADADRAMYEEINRRLVDAGRGMADTFFTNAQNWQTIPRVIGPLRQLGVPAVAVIDLDAVVAPKVEWNKFYKVMGIDEETADAIEAERQVVAAFLRALPIDGEHPSYKKIGITGLAEQEGQTARAFLDRLGGYGVFVVDAGELESWLPALELPRGSKAKWIVEAFRKLGSNPSSEAYVMPGEDGIWRFLDCVAAWVNDPERAGLPSA